MKFFTLHSVQHSTPVLYSDPQKPLKPSSPWVFSLEQDFELVQVKGKEVFKELHPSLSEKLPTKILVLVDVK